MTGHAKQSCREFAGAMAALGKCDTLKAGLRAASNKLGRTISRGALSGLLKRHAECCGYKGSPSSFLASSDVVAPPPVRDWIDTSSATAKAKPGEIVLLIPDAHVPYEDARAWALLLEVARSRKWSRVVVLGDFADCYAVSFHDKSPRRTTRIVDELDVVATRLRELEDATKGAILVYLEGNHEQRLSRYIARQAGALHGMRGLTFAESVDLRKWVWVPYHQSYRIADFEVTHDVGRAGVYAVRQSRMAYGGSIAIGHVHRMGIEHERTIDGRHQFGAAFGWLGDAEAVDYRHRSLARREWVHGCGVAYVDDRGSAHVAAVPFVDGRAWVAGSLVSV